MTIKVNKSDVGTGTAHQTIAGSTSPTVAALILEKKLPQISFGALSTAQQEEMHPIDISSAK